MDPLFQHILLDPADDSLRLIYADWLDDHGQVARAEFVRLQIEKSQWRRCPGAPHGPPGSPPPPKCECAHRENVCRHLQELFDQSPETQGWFGPALSLVELGHDWHELLGWFRRGLVAAVRCTRDGWWVHGDGSSQSCR